MDRKRAWALGLVAACALAFPLVGAAEGEGTPADPGASGAPPVALDALFKLPKRTPTLDKVEKGGATQRKWLERFDVARDDLARAKARLAATQSELEQLASGTQSWQVAAPGGGANAESGPLSFRLRQQIRRNREELEQAERQLSELRVEAELASVPSEWTGEVVPPPVEDAQP